MGVNVEHFEAELLGLLARHGLGEAVILFRNGSDLCVRGVASEPVGAAGIVVMGELAEEAVRAGQDRIIAAMRAAATISR